MIKQLLLAGLTGVACLVTLLADSGIGQAYGIYEKVMLAMILLFILLPMAKTLLKGEMWLPDLLIFVGLVVVIGLWPMFQGNKTIGIKFGWLLLTPFVVGQIPLSSRDMRTIGLTAGGFGLVLLISRLYLGIFDGWNPNNIAMVAFLSAAVCSAAPWEGLAKLLHQVYLVAMALLVLQLDSRSCLFGLIVLATAFLFRIIKPSEVLHDRLLRRLLLTAPALIALGVVLFQNLPIFDVLNDLSQEYFGKPIFNGRNEVWELGLQTLRDTPLLGTGFLDSGLWHNAAITMLASFGLTGYLLWLGLFDRIMEKARSFGSDQSLAACTVAFLTIMLQQSFELGLVSTRGNLLPYFLLGLILGRIRYLKGMRE